MKGFGLFLTLVVVFLLTGIGLTACSAEANIVVKPTMVTVDQQKAEELSENQSPDWVVRLAEEKNARQIFVVAGVGETTAYVSMHEKDDNGNWKEIMTSPGYIGKYGLGKTKEGEKR